ncbi:hypothetical protein AJ79_10362 [Helicocarpus griseus UAMH5409]|uniref:Uncharacterized protein n=1 Tax=Helicocarpus griseus UAMH5409 TaxID=1447875 RepID=A0A2B7WEE4_9EURO|nr:hypothetical protein AJ79_10362 [Helicocarpus griseus UAMH5409]
MDLMRTQAGHSTESATKFKISSISQLSHFNAQLCHQFTIKTQETL